MMVPKGIARLGSFSSPGGTRAERERLALLSRPSLSCQQPYHTPSPTPKSRLSPDMLAPAMMPVQPLKRTAKTLAKVIMAPVV